MLDFYKKRKDQIKIVLQILLFPLIMIGIDIFARSIFNFGTYFGSFIRGLFNLVL